MQTKVNIIYTGGTLGMKPSEHGLVPAQGLAGRLENIINQSSQYHSDLAPIKWFITENKPLLDSANMLPQDWETLAKQCRNIQNVDAIVIVHGTDTLAYTACALAFLLADINLPIIITGSQKPLEAKDSDAPSNLIGALVAASKASVGVWVYFHERLMPASRVVKKDAIGYDGFDTPRIEKNQFTLTRNPIQWQALPRLWADIHVAIVHISPGLSVDQFNAIIATKPAAIILKLYGMGTLADQNKAFISALVVAQQQNILLVAITQCYIGHVDFSVYATGMKLSELGVLSGEDLTLEAAYTKLMILFRMGYSHQQIKQHFSLAIASELSMSKELS